MSNAENQHTEAKASLFSQLSLFSGVFWTANWMELVERFAYYGVRVVLPVFMVTALENGGPEFDHIQKGTIYAIWALVQSFIPIFSGGFADRYGYKLSIAISTVLKIMGYMLMGYCLYLAAMLVDVPLAEARKLGTDSTYEIFFAGAMLLALGTAIFKPGVQGLLANQMPKEAGSLGWGLFYQCVNIGGFVGPLLAGYLRVLDWEYVFLACSIGISLNFIPLFFFKEPEREEEDARKTPGELLWEALNGLLEPRVFYFTVSFAGFWLMFYQLFDILPNFIDDWVDSRGAAAMLTGLFGDGIVPLVNGGNLTQEWMLNLNAGLISIFAFAFGYLTGKVEALTAIIIGIAISAVGIYGLGLDMSGWWILGMIAVFSMGEMAASPTKMRYMADIAPPGAEGRYMGYTNFTVGIGWSVGSIVAGEMYQTGGDKVELAKRYLIENLNVAADKVASLPKSEVLPMLEEMQGIDAWGVRELLWNTYSPGTMWETFTLIGIASLAAIIGYTYLVNQAKKNPDHSFNVNGALWVRALLSVIVVVFIFASWYAMAVKGYDFQKALAPIVIATLFGLILVASFVNKEESST